MMDVQVATIKDCVEYNKFGEQIIQCRLCGGGTTMLGTKLCDVCHDLEHLIHKYPERARFILGSLEALK